MSKDKAAYEEYGEESYVHGVNVITARNNNKIQRIVWTIFLLICAGVLVNNTTRQVITFLKFDHITKLDILFTHTLDFPAVTVCNVNRYRTSAFEKWDIVEMGPHLGMVDEDYNLLHEEQYPADWVNDRFTGTDWDAVIAANQGEEYDMVDFANRTGHRFTDVIQHCKWKAQLCNTSSWADEQTHYGRCFTFNGEGDHTLLKAGSGNGLEIILNVEHEEYLSTDESEDLGMKFLPHAPIEPPFLKELGFGLAPGYHYLIALQQREITGLPDPYGDCEEDHTTKYYNNYTVPGCRIECETELIYQKCGCKLVESPGNYPVCSLEQFDCAEETLVSIEKSDECTCQNPCHTTQYTFRMSMLELRESTIDLLRKEHPIPAHLTLQDLIVLNVYFDSLAYETIEQVPAYTWLDILSDFGGTMGLWLGASILAAVQIVEFCIRMCVRKCACCGKCRGESEFRAFKPTVSPHVNDNANGNSVQQQ